MIDFDKQIERDLDWREEELATFRELLTRMPRQTVKSHALFRAGWALIYAHYEGFCKFGLDLYLESLGRLLTNCRSLPECLFVYSIEAEIRKAKNLSSHDLFKFFGDGVVILREQAPKFSGIDTRSNLWPNLLEETLEKLDLSPVNVLLERRKLETLVARRNDIAHGKRVFIEDIEYYLEYERAATTTMYALALAVSDRYHLFCDEQAALQ
jgi:hypothetical protein